MGFWDGRRALQAGTSARFLPGAAAVRRPHAAAQNVSSSFPVSHHRGAVQNFPTKNTGDLQWKIAAKYNARPCRDARKAARPRTARNRKTTGPRTMETMKNTEARPASGCIPWTTSDRASPKTKPRPRPWGRGRACVTLHLMPCADRAGNASAIQSIPLCRDAASLPAQAIQRHEGRALSGARPVLDRDARDRGAAAARGPDQFGRHSAGAGVPVEVFYRVASWLVLVISISLVGLGATALLRQ